MSPLCVLPSLLFPVKAKLLVPWLLADERPHDLCKLWPNDCPSSALQVTAKFSFVYSVPRGLFERLSCRCHHHSSYICHWRSGLLMHYGCVKMLAYTDDNERQVTMTARAPDTGQNLFRLFHILWHCVSEMESISEMENVLVGIPGALLDRYITMKEAVQPTVGLQVITYCVASSGPQYDVDDLMKKALESPPSAGIETGTVL